MPHVSAIPNNLKEEHPDISLANVYVDVQMLKRTVNEILSISKENQEKLKYVDTFKSIWKFLLILVFFAFMAGIAVDDQAVVKKFYHYFTLN